MTTVKVDDPLFSLRKLFETWFYKPDFQAIRIVLGALMSHYLNLGDPAWLLVVAPPGTGKTTMGILGASGLPEVQILSSFTENTFLSGFYGHKQPGLLEKLGETKANGKTYTTAGNGIFLAKDFTSVLSMRRETRSAILGQLREIHDGQFRRDFGTGVTKVWKGRLTIIAAVTPVLDRYYSVFSVLGERFLQVRWHRPDSEEAGEWAIRQQGNEATIQKQAQRAMRNVFQVRVGPPRLPSDMQRRIAALAEVIALARTHVFRSGWGNREIEYAPESEANTRISKGLAAIARGIAALNRRPRVIEDDFQDVVRVGLDCLPENRRRLLIAIMRRESVTSIPIPETVRRRDLEDLEAVGIIEEANADRPDPLDSVGKITPTHQVWRLTPRAERLLRIAGLLQDEEEDAADGVDDLEDSASVPTSSH